MKILAHRGASAIQPENSRSAIEKALNFNADGIEVDLQLTSDGKIVVFHDWTLNRTSTGTGRLQDKTLKELKELDTGSWFKGEATSEKILTLDELLNIVPEDKILNLELKVFQENTKNLEVKVLKALNNSSRNNENIVISSFNHELIKNVNEISPNTKVGLLITSGMLNITNYLESNNLNLFSIHSSDEFITPSFIDDIHSLGIKSYVWTVNDMEAAKNLEAIGVDGIITDSPEKFITSFN